MRKLIFLLLILTSTGAHALEWKSVESTYPVIYVSNGKTSLVLTCAYEQTVFLKYETDSLCPETCINDDQAKGTLILDDTPYAVGLGGGDAGVGISTETVALPNGPNALVVAQGLLEKLSSTTNITLWSSQITPAATHFTKIRNPEKVKAFLENCRPEAVQ